MSLDADIIYNKLLKAGQDWADKKSASDLLEETKKSVLAKLMNTSAASSVAAKEMEAPASIKYRLPSCICTGAKHESGNERQD